MKGNKKSQMMVGFNHNIKHKGRIFHVQTEDSGVQNPHIITHLFVGGNILATKKTSYADIVKAENLSQIVRELMEEQHKAMLRNLVNGVYDEIDSTEDVGQKEPPPVTRPAAKPAPEPTAKPAPKPAAKPKPAAPRVAPAADKFPAPARPGRTQTAIPRHEAPTQTAMPAAKVLGTQIHEPPPPEEFVPRKETPSARVTIRTAAKEAAEKPAQPAAGARHLPPEVLAARRLAEHPVQKSAPGPTIFGEDLISEKSLDEVILGYLSGEGDEGA